MPHDFEILGADRASGEERRLVVSAQDADDATRRANAAGVMVAQVRAVAPMPDGGAPAYVVKPWSKTRVRAWLAGAFCGLLLAAGLAAWAINASSAQAELARDLREQRRKQEHD